MADQLIASSFSNVGSLGQVGASLSNQWNGLGALVGATGMFVLNCVIVFGFAYWFYWYFLKNNHIVHIKKYGTDRWLATRGRETFNKKNNTKGFSIIRVRDYSNQPVNGEHIGFMKTMFGVRPIVRFAYDKDGNLHPMTIKETGSSLNIEVLSPIEKAILINEIEKAERVNKLSPEAWVKAAMIVLVISLIIVFGGSSYVSYKNSKSSEVMSESMKQMALASSKIADALVGYNIGTNPNNASANGQPVNLITPINNIIPGQ